MEEGRMVVQSDVRLTVTQPVVPERTQEIGLQPLLSRSKSFSKWIFIFHSRLTTWEQTARSSAGSCRSASCRSGTHWSLRREGGTIGRPCSLCCICSPETRETRESSAFLRIKKLFKQHKQGACGFCELLLEMYTVVLFTNVMILLFYRFFVNNGRTV